MPARRTGHRVYSVEGGLVADTNETITGTDDGTGWASGRGPFEQAVFAGPATGTHITPLATNIGSITLTETFTAYPIWVPRTTTFDQISCEVVTTPGSAGALIRMGVADSLSTTYPSAPQNFVLDAGTISAETTGTKSIAINATLSQGLYWIGAVCQGSPATKPIVYSNVGPCPYPLIQRENTNHVLTLALGGWVRTVTTPSGALPATWGTYNGASDAVRVVLRAA